MIDDLKAIRKRRQVLGWSQHKLAKLANMSQSVIAKIETGRNQPTFPLLKRIDEALSLEENTISVKAEDVMTQKILTFPETGLAEDAVRLLTKHAYSRAPVLSRNDVVGLITEHSLLKAKPGDLIRQHMEDAPPTVSPQTPIKLLKEMLWVFPCVLVVEKGKRLGIVTKTDVLLK